MHPDRVSDRSRWLAAAATLLLLAPVAWSGGPVAAADAPPVFVARRTYEAPPVLGYAAYPDHTGLTQDEEINVGGVVFTIKVDGEEPVEVSLQGEIVDDLFGPDAVGGEFCVDLNQDGWMCDGDAGERSGPFCGSSPPVPFRLAPGVTKVLVFLHAADFQVRKCDPAAAPTATTGGVLDPAGGIFLTVAGSDDVAWCDDASARIADVCFEARPPEEGL